MPINYDASFVDSMPKNVAVQFLERVRKSGPAEAFRFPRGEGWESVTWQQTGDQVAKIAAGLLALGVDSEDRVGIISGTRFEWILADLGVMVAGCATTTVYPTTHAADTAYILGDSGSRIVFAEDDEQVAKLREHRDELTEIMKVIVFDGAGDGDWVISFDELAELGAGYLAEHPGTIEEHAEAIRPDQLATLIYTSGTTGPQKGVELTHAGMLTQLRGVHAAIPLPGLGRQVSFLPSAHVADRWTSHYSGFMAYANSVTCVADMAALPAALVQTRPTLFGAVPRVWEKFKAALEDGYPGDVVADALANPSVAEALRAKLGLDQARWVVTGAAPTPRGVLEFFTALGLPLCEMLGMSEVSCCVATNTPDAFRLGSVGQPLDTVEVRIADDGEVSVRGPQVMRGYRGAPEKTAEALDDEGWLATGDIGRLDEDGFLWIVDRKKELIINSAGKNMSPAAIEMAIRSAGNAISHVAVIGDRRRYNVALVVADPERADEEDLAAAVQEQIDRANATLSRVEQIKKFTLLPRDWRPGHELTPTMKLRRRVVDELYAAEIEELYA